MAVDILVQAAREATHKPGLRRWFDEIKWGDEENNRHASAHCRICGIEMVQIEWHGERPWPTPSAQNRYWDAITKHADMHRFTLKPKGDAQPKPAEPASPAPITQGAGGGRGEPAQQPLPAQPPAETKETGLCGCGRDAVLITLPTGQRYCTACKRWAA